MQVIPSTQKYLPQNKTKTNLIPFWKKKIIVREKKKNMFNENGVFLDTKS